MKTARQVRHQSGTVVAWGVQVCPPAVCLSPPPLRHVNAKSVAHCPHAERHAHAQTEIGDKKGTHVAGTCSVAQAAAQPRPLAPTAAVPPQPEQRTAVCSARHRRRPQRRRSCVLLLCRAVCPPGKQRSNATSQRGEQSQNSGPGGRPVWRVPPPVPLPQPNNPRCTQQHSWHPGNAAARTLEGRRPILTPALPACGRVARQAKINSPENDTNPHGRRHWRAPPRRAGNAVLAPPWDSPSSKHRPCLPRRPSLRGTPSSNRLCERQSSGCGAASAPTTRAHQQLALAGQKRLTVRPRTQVRVEEY